MTRRLLTICLTALFTLMAWAADAEVYDFKGLNQVATINRGESLGFTVNNGSNRTIYSFSIAGVEMDLSRFGAFMGGATDGSFTLKANGILMKGRILSVLNLKNGDKVTIAYKLASDAATLTLADATLIGNTSDVKTFESGKEYTITTMEETVHLDIISSANNNYITKVIVTPYEETATPDPTPIPEDAVSVFLTAGQSNTAGRCDNANLPSYIQTLGAAHDGAYQYCHWSYTNSSDRKADYEGVFSNYWPVRENGGKQFAYDAIVYYWLEQALQKNFYVVKHAMGGTSIDPTCSSSGDNHWSADADWLAANVSSNETDGHSMLKAFVSNIDKSLDALTAAGKSYDVKAMIWHQGESDRSGTGPDGYHDNLKAVVKYVRDYLVAKTGNSKYATLDFICGTVPKNSSQYNQKVYDALFTLATEDEHFHVIETSPGTFVGDQLHFDSNCAERLGIGMYNQLVDLGLVSGEKQTVPEPILPETDAHTMDFKQWTENEGMSNTEYLNIVLGETELTAVDGTKVYPAISCSGTGDFSEFADRFALADNKTTGNDKVRLRGLNGLFLASNQQTVLSVLNLQAGDTISIKFKATTSGTTTLAFLSENAYLKDDATKTALVQGTALVSESKYVMLADGQLDLAFGSTGSHSIQSITVIPAEETEDPTPGPAPEEPTTAVTIHTIGDSTMSHYDQSIPAQKGMDGWGDYLADCMKNQWTTVKNWADRGETAKSYYNGYWNGTKPDERPDFTQEINKEVQAGDYVIIQFGHNDSKAYDTATYEEWLSTLVAAVQDKGATPILAGSICRARFDTDGKITRLGRIDTGEDYGVGEDDHTYDYPYHAQQVAQAKGIEFIDVTSGVKELFESYGEAKTKALFPAGEKTHTNQLGARLIAKVAAKLLLGTALKTYVNQDQLALPAVEDIEVVIEDFGSEAVVSKKTLWTFDDRTDDVTTVTEDRGMYLRGDAGSSAITFNALTYSGQFPDDAQTPVSISKVAYSPGGTTVANISTSTAGKATGNKKTFAFNIARPGKFYAIAASNGIHAERTVKLVFSGVVKDEIPFDKQVGILTYTATTTGVIHLCAEGSFNLYAALFVPDMEAGTEEDWNYQMVKTRDDGFWTYCNRMADNQQVPAGLTAYAVSAIDGDGKALLTDIGSVIPAGMGVLVKGDANTEYPMVSTAEVSTYTGENLLVGNTTLQFLSATIGDKTNYLFENATAGFVKATGSETIHEKQAYLSTSVQADQITLSMPTPDDPVTPDEPSASVAYRFSDAFNGQQVLTFGETALRVLENNGSKEQARPDFYAITNNSDELPVDGRLSWRIPSGKANPELVSGGVKPNGYPFAVHNLVTGDQVTVVYSGGTLKNYTPSTANTLAVDGTPLAAAADISTNQVLTVTATAADANYIVLFADSKAVIYGIYVNQQAPKVITSLSTPTLTFSRVENAVAVYTAKYDADATLHYLLESDGQEVVVNPQGGICDITVTRNDNITLWTTYEQLTSEVLATVVYAPTTVEPSDGVVNFSDFKTLPADMPVDLDETRSVLLDGTTLYHPTALTASTFGGKVVFSKTDESSKIRLRTNGTLHMAKGKNMDIAFLGLKAGEVIAISYTGSMTLAADAPLSTGDVAAARRTLGAGSDFLSGQVYHVTADTDLHLHVALSASSVAVSKLLITTPPTATAPVIYDFATAVEYAEEVQVGAETTVFFSGSSSAQKFNFLNNNSARLPLNGKLSIQAASGTLAGDGLKASKRHLALHGLAEGDQIIIRYSAGELSFKGHETYGNRVSVQGTTLAAGDVVTPGAVITVDQVDYLNNTTVFYLDNTCVVSGIFINQTEVDKLWAPSLTESGTNTIVVTAGRSAMGNKLVTCYTTDGTEPSLTNGTSGPYSSFDVELQDQNGLYEVKAVSYTAGGVMSPVSSIVTYVGNIPGSSYQPTPIEDDETLGVEADPVAATTYYISPNGSDKNDGLTLQTPLATLGAAQNRVQAGDVVYILPGTYLVGANEIAKEESSGPYKVIFDLSKSGEPGRPISYIGLLDDQGQRPVFDLSQVNPSGYRVTGFLVTGSNLLLKNFEVVGIRVNISTHTQSENIRVSNASYNTFENIACHDGMGIGFYLQRGSSYNLIVNCDGYNNYDYVSEEGSGDQNDAFGCHVRADSPGNIFIGCRAWNNADDGFDLISCASPVTFSYSIAYKNGYDANGVARHDGNGFKAGGFGMSSAVTEVTADNVPVHEVAHCLAVSNRSNGIYSNHHVGGLYFHHNSSFKNARANYSFVNRKGLGDDEVYDVDGYGHVIENNLSVTESGKYNHVTGLSQGVGDNTVNNNSFLWGDKNAWLNANYGVSLFENTKNANLTAARDSYGMLAVATRQFMRQQVDLGFGCSFDGYRQAIADARRQAGATSQTTEVKTLRREAVADGRYYTLQGIPVERPGKGIYVQNGRKIVIK